MVISISIGFLSGCIMIWLKKTNVYIQIEKKIRIDVNSYFKITIISFIISILILFVSFANVNFDLIPDSFGHNIPKLIIALLILALIRFCIELIKPLIIKEVHDNKYSVLVIHFIIVIIIIVIIIYIENKLNLKRLLSSVVITYFLVNEGKSILDSAYQMGLPIPRKLIHFLNLLSAKNIEDKED